MLNLKTLTKFKSSSAYKRPLSIIGTTSALIAYSIPPICGCACGITGVMLGSKFGTYHQYIGTLPSVMGCGFIGVVTGMMAGVYLKEQYDKRYRKAINETNQ
jgi:hypothetical protein